MDFFLIFFIFTMILFAVSCVFPARSTHKEMDEDGKPIYNDLWINWR